MESRIICFDCGAQIKHRKAIKEAVIENAEGNIYRVFCKKCARKRNLLVEENKSTKVIRTFIPFAIVVVSITFWNWYYNSNFRWHEIMGFAGIIVLWILFKLYDELK
jgi:hypothetical protein